MTFNETKQWLRRAWYIDAEISQMIRKHYEEYARVTSITAQMDGLPGNPSKDPHKFDRLTFYEDGIKDTAEELKRVRAEIWQQISKISDPVRRMVLRDYYLADETGKHKSFDTIAYKLGYSTRQIIRIHNDAVHELSEKMSLNVTNSLCYSTECKQAPGEENTPSKK